MEVTGQSYAPVALSPRPSGGPDMLGKRETYCLCRESNTGYPLIIQPAEWSLQ